MMSSSLSQRNLSGLARQSSVSFVFAVHLRAAQRFDCDKRPGKLKPLEACIMLQALDKDPSFCLMPLTGSEMNHCVVPCSLVT
jgi:hypothetical protein